MKIFWLVLLTVGFACIGYSHPTPLTPPNTPARLCDRNLSFSLWGDFIYWKARVEELNAVGTAHFSTSPERLRSSFISHEINFKYSPGFRLGAAVQLPFDGWNITSFWTHYHTHPSRSFHSSTHNIVDLNRTGGGNLFVAMDSSVGYNLMLNKIDLQCGRCYNISRSWTVYPSFGICALWVNQHYRYQYKNVQTSETSPVGTLPVGDAFAHAKIQFWGVGPSCAFEGGWNIGWGFSIMGKVSATLACGQHSNDTHGLENVFIENNNAPPSIVPHHVRVRGKGKRVRPVVQMFIGLSYEKCFVPNSLAGKVNLGYESLYFMEQILQITSVGPTDLSLSGLTLSASLDF